MDTTKEVRRVSGNLPITVVIVAGVAGWLAANGHYASIETRVTILGQILNPLYYAESLLYHTDWNHYWGNMTSLGFVSVGVLLTYLTNNRHVLGVILVSQVLAAFVYGIGIGQLVYGSSTATFGLWGATVVRTVGIGKQEGSSETFQVALLGLFVVFGGALLLVSIVGASSGIAHFAHLLGFVFGGAYESMYVLSENEAERGKEGDKERGHTLQHES